MKKVVILTGAGGGIGITTAKELQKEGYLLCLTDLPKSLESLKKNHPELIKEASLFPCDIRDLKQIKKTIKSVIAKFGKIDILINNAGVMRPEGFIETSYEEIEEQIQVNLFGTIYFTKECFPFLKVSQGKIIIISSLAGVVPAPNHSIYSATKFALRSLSLSLGLELKSHGIGVVSVLPGTIDSPMTNYMAARNSSPMAYLNPPISPTYVSRAIRKAIDSKSPEIYVPYSQGLMAKIGLFSPSLLSKIYPMMAKKGISNLKKWSEEGIFK
ncbi:SDR family NAD(P)-dependent oxidoreductase [Leptospira ilyithenensis]|uniref:SDR family oxidoreductase n=1 Tax=Leptospira ilyithenensis TaxID=2484901 RepID=A0A4V3JWV4_9LEPT|nr:SDR family oxidoreductase [Leptospira ilyithenensis]TGN08358.1 SDR family oxidoreductase [Leptospira ilyithenensis]